MIYYKLSKLLFHLNKLIAHTRGKLYLLRGIKSRGRLLVKRNVVIVNPYRVEFDDSVTIEMGSYIKCSPKKEDLTGKPFLRVGKNTWIGNNTFIEANKSISIGDNVLIAPNCYITDSSHGYSDKTLNIKDQEGLYDNVIIGDNVWVGTNSVILKGVTIGDGAIVAANSVVNKDVPNNVIFGGSPAIFIKKR
ncbi:acyltransferase [Winogradskyella sp.]|uniref:acyltransferase n=1 Tax=Winogradskyella sp. TaxID=1883156 RepID=UPI0025EF82DC|nr:acyltransferase [Winogradskyella sp.]